MANDRHLEALYILPQLCESVFDEILHVVENWDCNVTNRPKAKTQILKSDMEDAILENYIMVINPQRKTQKYDQNDDRRSKISNFENSRWRTDLRQNVDSLLVRRVLSPRPSGR